MPPKAKKTVKAEADAERHEKIFQILNDVQAELSSSDDDDEEKMGSGQSEPTDPSTLTTCLSQSRKPRGQSEPLVAKRPRSEAQIASLARAQQSAQKKRAIRDKQREVEKVASIAQEVARILDERRSLRRNHRESQFEESFDPESQLEVHHKERQPVRDRRYKEEDASMTRPLQVLRNPFD